MFSFPFQTSSKYLGGILRIYSKLELRQSAAGMENRLPPARAAGTSLVPSLMPGPLRETTA